MRHRRATRVVAAILPVLALPASGCATGCDDVGCPGEVLTASLSAPVDRFPLTVEICVEGNCVTRSPEPTTGPPAAQPELIEVPLTELGLESIDGDDSYDVTVHMTDRDGVVVHDVTDTVRPNRYRAGGDCGPTCTVLELRY